MAIPLTQYTSPNGRKRIVTSPERPEDVENKAIEIMMAGFGFACEILRTGPVVLYITSKYGDHSAEMCENTQHVEAEEGPARTLDKMIRKFDIKKEFETIKSMEEEGQMP